MFMFARFALPRICAYRAGVCSFSYAEQGIQFAPFMKMRLLFTRKTRDSSSLPVGETVRSFRTSSFRRPIRRVTFSPFTSTV